MKYWTRVTVVIGLILAAGQGLAAQGQGERSSQGEEEGSAKAKRAKAEAAKVETRPTLANSDYKIGPQDIVRVDVWKEPDISRIVPVRPDGKISLPFLNDVQAAGLTPTGLADAIREGLKNYITDPQVTVTVTEINSLRVFVTGEVTRPGIYPLLPNMTVLQALTSCGGFTQFANVKKIYVLRLEDGKQVKLPVNYKSLVSAKKPEENITLKSGDTIVVP
jgi:polysaccharide export outer membrane protein